MAIKGLQPKQFEDADMAKLGILEELDFGEGTEEVKEEKDLSGTTEIMGDIDEQPEGTIKSMATGEEPAAEETPQEEPAPEGTPAEGDAPSEAEASAEQPQEELSDEDLEKFLQELAAAEEATQSAAADTDKAVETGDSEAIAQALEAERVASAEKDRIIDRLTMQLKIEKEGSDKIIEEKFLLESDLREKSKIADIVGSDDTLKQLVVLKKRSEQDPSMKQKYIDTLRDMYESATGEPISAMVDTLKKYEKSGMGGDSYMFEGNEKSSPLIASGMLEEI